MIDKFKGQKLQIWMIHKWDMKYHKTSLSLFIINFYYFITNYFQFQTNSVYKTFVKHKKWLYGRGKEKWWNPIWPCERKSTKICFVKCIYTDGLTKHMYIFIIYLNMPFPWGVRKNVLLTDAIIIVDYNWYSVISITNSNMR